MKAKTPAQVLVHKRSMLLRDLTCCVIQLQRIQQQVLELDTNPETPGSLTQRLFWFHDKMNRLNSMNDACRIQWGWKQRETFESCMAKLSKEIEIVAKMNISGGES